MTPEQQQWVASMKAMRVVKPVSKLRPPRNKCRLAVHRFISHALFDQFIGLVIVLNIGVMG
eukprot:6141935-Prymnesium_polylepis.1